MVYLFAWRSIASVILAIFIAKFLKKRFFPSTSLRKFNRKNPLEKDCRVPIKPLITDDEKRSSVLKKVFTEDVVNEKWDAIIIGSGIGGLSTAALLSKAGLKVLVLEKHGKAGGACHIFKSDGYEFDVGIHYVGEFNRPTLARTLLEQISQGQIQWQSMDNIFDVVIMNALSPQQRKYNIPSGKGQWQEQLLKQFPGEEKAINRFFSMIQKVSKNVPLAFIVKILPLWLMTGLNKLKLLHFMSDFFKLGKKTLEETITELTDNPELRLLLSYCWGTYGVPPSRGPFNLQCLLIKHYENGASYPVGGASEIPFQIIHTIENAGGRVLMKAPVTEIIVQQSKVTGVRVGKQGSVIEAPIVISDAGIHNTFLKLLPKNVAQESRLWNVTQNAKPGIGCFSVFIGLKGSSEELGLRPQNVWAFLDNDPEKGFESFNELTLEEAMERKYPVLFIGFPSAKDPSWNDRYPGKSTITVVTFCNYDWFQKWSGLAAKKRGDEYDSIKNKLGYTIADQVASLFPTIKNAIDKVIVGTPVTNEHYLNAYEGSIYGLDHLMDRFQPEMTSLLRPQTDIDGLYLTGQDIFSAGFVSALFAGLLCASSILDKNLFSDLISLHKKTKLVKI